MSEVESGGVGRGKKGEGQGRTSTCCGGGVPGLSWAHMPGHGRAQGGLGQSAGYTVTRKHRTFSAP